jgi:cell division transport system ATP-binding protein
MIEDYQRNTIEFKNVGTGYLQSSVLENVNFTIGKGEFVYLIGKTGAGKSSILKMVYADLKPRSGQLIVGDYDIATIKKREVPLLRRKLGIVFQDFQLLPDRDVVQNILFAMRATGWKDKAKMKAKVSDLMMRVGLASKLHSMPHQLSGGESPSPAPSSTTPSSCSPTSPPATSTPRRPTW